MILSHSWSLTIPLVSLMCERTCVIPRFILVTDGPYFRLNSFCVPRSFFRASTTQESYSSSVYTAA